MRTSLLTGLVLMFAGVAFAAPPAADLLREMLRLQEAVLESEMRELERHQRNVEDAWVRVERLAADLVRAERVGEDLDNLRLRDDDLRTAEGELLMLVLEAQRRRSAVVSTRNQIEKAREELARLTSAGAVAEDPLTGTWRIVVEPGGQEGTVVLRLDGTLVTGNYSLSGGWAGSFRGTLVAEKVRLERIDSQLGFAAIYYGRLVADGSTGRLEGTWEATQLTTGLPSAGTWVAVRQEEAGAGSEAR